MEEKFEYLIPLIVCEVIMVLAIGFAVIHNTDAQGKLVAGTIGSVICFGFLSFLEMKNERKQGVLYRTQEILEESKLKS
ncbi:hypothetical protein [Aminipila sp.]|uniref:hypothetical protein n=1 Tax=Aminipila sp. TaxID=2060095 RepID=UPI00289F5CD6|nr:hypothetical protein [Aminipila sp.]